MCKAFCSIDFVHICVTYSNKPIISVEGSGVSMLRLLSTYYYSHMSVDHRIR